MKPNVAIISNDITFPMYFKNDNYEILVITHFSNEEIHAKIISTRSKLIILDGTFSEMSSLEIIHDLRLNEKIELPIWFFPEITSNDYITKSYTLGVNKIYYKPFDPVIISNEIIAYLL
ncbi:MAG: hypothetical protein GZ091_12165 [Paludibacter sp.]|nr:hypothetical protein [Paludibacter sp.]